MTTPIVDPMNSWAVGLACSDGPQLRSLGRLLCPNPGRSKAITRLVKQTAASKILDHASITVKKYDWVTLAIVNVMKSNAVHDDKPACWGVCTLCVESKY